MRQNKLPKVNFIGNKENLSDWICDNFPDNAKSVFDVFSGGTSISYNAKKRGLKVISNDILKINFMIAKSLIENKNIILNKKDVELIFSGKPIKKFMFDHYANKIYFPNECMQLDQYRENISKLDNEYKQALALTIMRRAMIRKMPYSRFNIKWDKVKQLRNEEYSYSKYKRRRAYHNKSFKYHFLDNLDMYNEAVFDNKKNNIAYNDDALNLVGKIKADIIYLDPPYSGTMSNYHGFYGALDDYILNQKAMPFDNNFINKEKSIKLLDKLFSKMETYRYWFLSYNNNSYPDKKTLIEIIRKYSNKINVIEKKHNYKITGKGTKNSNREYLFIVER